MSSRNPPEPPAPLSGEGFVERWSRRKLASGSAPATVPEPEARSTPAPDTLDPPPGDQDMPPLASLDESSDYSAFLSERVTESLRRQALRKLFHSPSLNLCDGLDDYAEDFTGFAVLGGIITADMRHQQSMAEQKARQVDEETGTEDAGSERLADVEEEEGMEAGQDPESLAQRAKPDRQDEEAV